MLTTKPKLLMIFPSTLRGGVEEYNLTAARGAKSQGWAVHAAFPERAGTAALIQDFEDSGVTYHPLDIAEDRDWLPGLTRHFPRLLRTLRLLMVLKPNVVQITLPAPDYCLGSILACGLLQVPTVVRFGLVLPLETAVNPLRIRAYGWVRSRRQQWVTISQHNRCLLSGMFQIPQEDIVYIHNGVNLTRLQPLEAEARLTLRCQVRQELALPESAQLVLTVGRLNAQKGYADLVPAIPTIARQFPDVRFVWVGDGDLRSELENQLATHQVADRVLLLGYRSDVPRLLQAADLFVFPTHFEGGQSFAISEAMAARLPIVTSDASGIPEVVHHQVHGLVFPRRDREALRDSLQWALQHPEDMQVMATAAQKQAQTFTEEKMLKLYGDLWRRLSQRVPPPPATTTVTLNPHSPAPLPPQKPLTRRNHICHENLSHLLPLSR